MPSRLAQLRDNRAIALGCLALNVVILGSLVIQRMSQAQTDRIRGQQIAQRQQTLQQKQEEKRLAYLQEARATAEILAGREAWKRWQAHIGKRCSVIVSRLENRPYLGTSISKGRLAYEGVIICDRDYAGILKGPQLVPMWVVPRSSSKRELPIGQPPPGFRPIPQIEQIDSPPTENHEQEELLQEATPTVQEGWQ